MVAVDAGSVEEAEQLLAALSSDLALEVTPQSPYRYRRSALEWEIGHWQPKLFCDGVQKLAEFFGTELRVADAYAKSMEGNVEKLTSFFDLKSFTDSIGRKAALFDEIVIRLEGRSQSVGIGVRSDHKKLRVRTSLPPADTDPIVEAWPEGLGLKAIKATDSGSDPGSLVPAPAPKESTLWKVISAVAALLGVISVGGVGATLNMFSPEYKVVVTSPILHGGSASSDSPEINVDWYLEAEGLHTGGPIKDLPANIVVDGNADANSRIAHKPPYRLTLPVGSHSIKIDSSKGAPLVFEVTVKGARTGTDKPGVSSPR